MKVKTIFRRPLALALSLLLCAVCLTPEAAAVRAPGTIEGFDGSKTCSLTIPYPHAEEAVTRPQVRLYQVASVDAQLSFVPVVSLSIRSTEIPGNRLRSCSSICWVPALNPRR